jgi:hypothetical protein
MSSSAAWRALLLLLCFTTSIGAAELPPGDLEHMREELGINSFTAPSIERLFQSLDLLKPIPFEKVWRTPPDDVPPSRARMALLAGSAIADGFLAVAAEKQSRIEPVGRALLRLSKGLGVGDRVTRRSRSLLELAAREQWDEMRRELARAQAEVEGAMLALKDEEVAHLVALGGWIRGLEITSAIAAADPTPERARVLLQPDVLGYFLDRVSTLNPNLKKDALFARIERDLRELQQLMTSGRAPDAAEVARIQELARGLAKAMRAEPR